jgi:pyruvate dehydrogenase E2 component (dihydrolipoamide acetyltransferase)
MPAADAQDASPVVGEVIDATSKIAMSSPTSAPDPSPRHSQQRVTPVARRLAETHGIDLSTLTGTGPSGRITKKDVLGVAETTREVQAAVPPSASPPEAPVVEAAGSADAIVQCDPSPTRDAMPTTPVSSGALALQSDDRREPVSGMRQTIARRLVESKQTIPHYQVSMSFDMDPMVTFRKQLNTDLAEYEIKLSVNDLIVRACALSMARNPLMNASWDGDAIVYHNRVHVGVAVALSAERGGGLVVPVIHDADRKSLRSISAETRALAAKARDRGLSPEDMDGATFTVSNLGMFGVDDFTAIINPPNSAILAVGGTLQKPVVRDNEIVVGWVMKATLSNDHRVVDGATAAAYLNTLKELIEHPSMILV